MGHLNGKPPSFREHLLARALSTLALGDSAFEKYGVLPQKGDLVLLQSAPPSIWQISIYEGEEPVLYDDEGVKRQIDTRRYLRALGTGEQSNWVNVGVRVLSREWFSAPMYRWNEAQFEFDRRWRAEGRKADLYMMLQSHIEFEGQGATCHWRWRFDMGKAEDLPPPAHFKHYAEVPRSHMREAVMSAVAHDLARQKERRSQNDLSERSPDEAS